MLELAQQTGIGAQFGGKYFCHDVRIIRLPRHGASCPVAMAVSCSADRQAKGKITRDGVFLEQLETDPARFLPEVTTTTSTTRRVVHIDLNRPMDEILAELSQHPVKTRVHADRPDGRRPRHRPRQDQGAPRRRRADARSTSATTASTTPARPRRRTGYASGLVRPDDGRADGQLRRPVPGRRRLDGHAGQGQPVTAGDRGVRPPRRVLPRLDRRAGRPAGARLHQAGRGARVPRARHGGGVEDRGRRLPCVHRRRRQGQRLLRARPPRGGAVVPSTLG